MKFLRRIWMDIQRGENVDLYVTVFAAILLVLLNIIGIVPSTLLTPLTLAVLGLLALATLGNRYQFEALVNQITKSSSALFQENVASTFEADLQSASEIWFVGVSLSRTVKSHYALLENSLRKGATIRVLIIDPEAANTVALVAKREYGERFSDERIRSLIRGTMADLCSLKKLAPDKLSIRVIQYPLGFGAVATNPLSSKGVLYLEHYAYKMAGGSLPKFTIKPHDGQWYDFYRTELEMLWKDGVDWQC